MSSSPRPDDDPILWTSDAAGVCTWLSPSWHTFGGHPAGSGPGPGWLDAVHPDDRERVEAAFREASAAAAPFQLELRLRRHDGAWRSAVATAAPRFEPDGAFAGHVGSVRDVTDERRAEEQLRRSEYRYRSLAEQTASMIGITAPDGGMRDVWRWREFTGQGEAEYRGLGFLDAVHPEDRDATRRAWLEAIATESVAQAEFRVRRRDGVYRWMIGRGVPIRDGEGRVVEWLGTMTDIDDARRARDLVAASETRLRRIVESNVIGIVFWDEVGRITDANDAFLAMTGHGRDDLAAGRLDWRLIVAPERLAVHASAIDEIRARGISTPIESEAVRADGSRVPILCAGASLGEAPLHGVTWVVDIRERKQAERQREQLLALSERARMEAEHASRAKDQLLAMLGHELRNPLAAVRNAVEAARLDPAARDRALEIAARQTDQLARLVDDLLDVARLTYGRVVLQRDRVALDDVVERAVQTTRHLIEERGHAFASRLPPRPVVLDADPARLAQVFANLLSNAARYTEPGGRIALEAERRGGEVVVTVRDTGVGIAPELLPHVFDLFSQADRPLDRAGSGLGLGLTLVKRLVEQHGGRVRAQSDGPGRGAAFTVHLPAVDGVPARPAAAAPAPSARRRLLVVEDNTDAAESLALLLQMRGHDVRVAHDGPSGLEAARAQPPELMLVDIGLPGIDGYEVARQARREPSLRGVVLVALTGYGREEDQRRAAAAGFDHHLVKPVDPLLLHRVVDESVRERE